MRRFTFGSLLISAAAISVVAGLAGAGPVDYSKLPPTADELRNKLNQCDLTLSEAISKAEAKVGGKANSAKFDFTSGGMIYTVDVVTEDAIHTVIINAVSGEITGTTFESGSGLPGWDLNGAELKTTDTGLMYYDIVEGEGALPEGPSDQVTVHYTGYLVDGSKFDSSVDRGQPATFALNRVIPGWTEGVGSMKVGGKRKLLIPYQLAYGERGRPGAIPPRALLVFDVELLELP